MSAAPSTPAAEVDERAATSFMDLPPELRLEVYSYLFDWQDRTMPNHHKCCHLALLKPEGKRCICRGGHIYPQILAINRTVFKEAMPLLYGPLELHTIFSTQRSNKVHHSKESTGIPNLPAYATNQIKNVVICVGVIFDKSPIVFGMEEKLIPFLNQLRMSFPNLEHVRLHLEDVLMPLGEGQKLHGNLGYRVDFVEEWAWKTWLMALQGLLYAPKLQQIAIETHVVLGSEDVKRQTRISAEMTKVALLKEATYLGRTIDVSHRMVLTE